MPEKQKPSGLETLVVRILEAESLQEVDRDEIAYMVFHEAFGSDYQEAAEFIGLDTGVLHFLASADDWRDALKNLLSDRKLVVTLSNELAQLSNYDYCPRNSSLSTAFGRLLDTVKLPIVRPPIRFRGRTRLGRFLTRTRQELSDLTDDDQERFKDLADRGWGELETLTKILVRFYGNLFGESGEIADVFSNAEQVSGLNQRFDRMRGVQNKIEARTDDEVDFVYKDERIYCQWRLGRPTPFGDFITGETVVDLSEVPSRWSIKWQDVLAKYDNSQKAASGTISISLLNYYKTNVDFYRHFYAHSNRQEWINAGREMVHSSFEAAAEIIQRMLDLNLCPDMIIPIAVGRDGFQRRVAFFVHEQDLEPNGLYARKNIKVMFLRGDQAVDPHRVYFCPHPTKPGMFEPLLVPADEII